MGMAQNSPFSVKCSYGKWPGSQWSKLFFKISKPTCHEKVGLSCGVFQSEWRSP